MRRRQPRPRTVLVPVVRQSHIVTEFVSKTSAKHSGSTDDTEGCTLRRGNIGGKKEPHGARIRCFVKDKRDHVGGELIARRLYGLVVR